MKKFNRPLPRYGDEGTDGPVRAINLPREGSGIEGVYADVAAREAMQISMYEQRSQTALSQGLRYWMLVLCIWVVVTVGILQLSIR
jgi:hypothetical protein